jgi:Domain of unknown function (DUF4908)
MVAMSTAVPGATAAEGGRPLRIGHYSTRDGMAGFVLDRLGETVKLRFDGSEEVFALSKEPAPLGALSLRDDNDGYVLRISTSGGITLFRPGFRDGAGVVRDQDAKALEIPAATKSQAADKAAALGRQLSRVAGTALVVNLEAPSLADSSEAWATMADAVAVVAIVLKSTVADALGREAVATNMERVVIRDTGHISIALDGRTLVVEIDADSPIVGRPSSRRIEAKIGDLLYLHGQSLKVGQIKVLQETLLAKDAADINKACGTNFSVKFDWAAAPNADLEHYSASGYCDSALSAVRGICNDVAGSDAVKQKIKRITCGFGAKRTIALKNGALDYKINLSAPSTTTISSSNICGTICEAVSAAPSPGRASPAGDAADDAEVTRCARHHQARWQRRRWRHRH